MDTPKTRQGAITLRPWFWERPGGSRQTETARGQRYIRPSHQDSAVLHGLLAPTARLPSRFAGGLHAGSLATLARAP